MDKVRFPTEAEKPEVMKHINEAFTAHGLDPECVKERDDGGITAATVIAEDTFKKLQSDLFSVGVVIVPIGDGLYGFAVRQ